MTEAPTPTETVPAKQGPDLFALAAGVLSLVISAYVLTGADWFSGIDTRWVLAGGAVLVGLLLLGASLRPTKDRNR